MSSLDQVLQAALALPEEDRARLIDELSATLGPGEDDAPLDEAWMAEIQRRSQESDAGQVRAIPWDEVRRQAQEKHRANG
jgi:putative addiction module component (TIGR02574 family)